MITRDQIVEAARKRIGIPWRHQGRNENGIDCVGLIVMVRADIGLPHYDVSGYARNPDTTTFLQHIVQSGCKRIGIAHALPGDIIAFKDASFPCHIGIRAVQLTAPTIIHAQALRKKVVEEEILNELILKQVAAFRFPGVE